MGDQAEKIKLLYQEGILTQEEMEAELKKAVNSKSADKKRLKIWWRISIIIILILAIVVSINLTKPKNQSASNLEFAETVVVDNVSIEDTSYEISETSRETAQWEVTDINGSESIQAEYHSPKYGILRMAYSPKEGFRFGLFNDNLSPIDVKRMMIGILKEGEEFSQLAAFPSNREGNYIYYNNSALFDILNSGSVQALTIERASQDGTRDESVDYRWYIKLNPGELLDRTKGL